VLYVTGLDQVPENGPSNVTLVHWSLDVMVGIGALLLALVLWFAIASRAGPCKAWWRHLDAPWSPSEDYRPEDVGKELVGTGCVKSSRRPVRESFHSGWMVPAALARPW
jgi:hypothetical protein